MIAIVEISDDTLTNLAVSEKVFNEFFTYISFLSLFFFLFSLIEIEAPLLKAWLTNLFPSKFFPLMPKKIKLVSLKLEWTRKEKSIF